MTRPFVKKSQKRGMLSLKRISDHCLGAVIFGVLTSVGLWGQEFTRASLTSPEMVRVLNRDERYNLRIGGVRLQVDSVLQMEYNDNLNLTSSKLAISDLVFRPGVQVLGVFELSDSNKITLSLGMSYAKYMSHPELDSKTPLISPDSATEFVMAIGDVRIRTFDRFRVLEDPTSSAQLGGIAAFRRFENDMGFLADWDLNQFILSGGYTWGNFSSMDLLFESLDRNTHTFTFEPKYLLNEGITIGLKNQMTMINYAQKIQNNSTSTESAPFIEAQLTKQSAVKLEVGYQEFSSERTGTIGDTSSFASFYTKLFLKNNLNKYLSHGLSISRMAEAGIGSNYIDRRAVDYVMDWAVVKDLGLRGGIFYENFRSSGKDQEIADRYGLTGRLSYPLTISTMAAFEYRFTYKDTNLFDKDYIQNVTSVIVSYSF